MITVKARISVNSTEDTIVVVSVKDEGIGITSDDSSELFKPFSLMAK